MPATEPDLRIGDISRQSGVAVSAIRYYEARGLVEPAPRRGGKRVFDAATLIRVRAITALQAAGFTLDEIGELLRQDALSRSRRYQLTRAKLEEVRRRIDDLHSVAESLERALDCGCDSLEHCPLVVAPRPSVG